MDRAKKVVILGLFLSSIMGAAFAEFFVVALTQIARELQTSIGMAQYSIAIFLIGGAVSGAFFGPISDRFGRRNPFLLAMVLVVFSSILCTLVKHDC